MIVAVPVEVEMLAPVAERATTAATVPLEVDELAPVTGCSTVAAAVPLLDEVEVAVAGWSGVAADDPVEDEVDDAVAGTLGVAVAVPVDVEVLDPVTTCSTVAEAAEDEVEEDDPVTTCSTVAIAAAVDVLVLSAVAKTPEMSGVYGPAVFDRGPSPIALTATTMNSYWTPFVSPVTTAPVDADTPSANSIHPSGGETTRDSRLSRFVLLTFATALVPPPRDRTIGT